VRAARRATNARRANVDVERAALRDPDHCSVVASISAPGARCATPRARPDRRPSSKQSRTPSAPASAEGSRDARRRRRRRSPSVPSSRLHQK
jgi:hypothetical protein